MRIIAHRGNLHGPNLAFENTPDYIDQSLKAGHDAEVDVWYENGSLFLGHDAPDLEIRIEWLLARGDYLWLHAKTIHALGFLSQMPSLNSFFHENDPVTLTTKNYLWTFPGEALVERSVDVMPETNAKGAFNSTEYNSIAFAVCTDFAGYILSG